MECNVNFIQKIRTIINNLENKNNNQKQINAKAIACWNGYLNYSLSLINLEGALMMKESFVDYFGPDRRLIGFQYGRINWRIYCEVLNGTNIEWIAIQEQWDTPSQYLAVMRKDETLGQWWRYYGELMAARYSSNTSSNTTQSLRRTRKRKLSEFNIGERQSRVDTDSMPSPKKRRLNTNHSSFCPKTNNNPYLMVGARDTTPNSNYVAPNPTFPQHFTGWNPYLTQQFQFHEPLSTMYSASCSTSHDEFDKSINTQLPPSVTATPLTNSIDAAKGRPLRRTQRQKKSKKRKSPRKYENVKANLQNMTVCDDGKIKLKSKKGIMRIQNRPAVITIIHFIDQYDDKAELYIDTDLVNEFLVRIFGFSSADRVLISPSQHYNLWNNDYVPNEDVKSLVQDNLNETEKDRICSLFKKVIVEKLKAKSEDTFEDVDEQDIAGEIEIDDGKEYDETDVLNKKSVLEKRLKKLNVNTLNAEETETLLKLLQSQSQ